jgi:hypothetical protein
VDRAKISVGLSLFSILSIVVINYLIAERFLSITGKSRAFFFLIEADYWYRHLFIIPGLAAFVLAYKSEEGTLRGIAYTLAALVMVISLIDIWKIFAL